MNEKQMHWLRMFLIIISIYAKSSFTHQGPPARRPTAPRWTRTRTWRLAHSHMRSLICPDNSAVCLWFLRVNIPMVFEGVKENEQRI